MYRTRKPGRMLWAVGTFCLIFVLLSRAEAFDGKDRSTWARRLGRGLANAGLGFFEVPIKMIHVGERHGMFAGLTYGPVLGAGATAYRMSVGLVEVATFPIPIRRGGKPLVEPEFLFEPQSPPE